MIKIHPDLFKAAETLGANRMQVFYHITLKLAAPGIIIGCIFVFILGIGDYLTPTVLGGIVHTVGRSILNRASVLAYPEAAAWAVILVAITLGIVTLLLRIVDIRRMLA